MKILFGVFNWGLGHAMRSTPLINALLNEGHQVDIISTGRALGLLRTKFQDNCGYFDIPEPAAPKNYGTLQVLSETYRILSELKQAQKATAKLVGSYDRVISDCRFDVVGDREKSFLVNHQLRFVVPPYEFFTSAFLAYFMNRFSHIIVPDFPDRILTGRISTNPFYRGKIDLIGTISNLKKRDLTQDVDYFVSISGPEPVRSMIETKLLNLARQLKGRVVVTLGNPRQTQHRFDGNVEIHSFLTTTQQEEMMNRAKHVICNAGYTTIMELIELEKNAQVIPTPNQPEQTFLAHRFRTIHAPWKTKQSIKNFLKVVL